MKLQYTMKPPSEDTGYEYEAEIPSFPGCRAWGESPEEAYDNLLSVAQEFMASYEEYGDGPPAYYDFLARAEGDAQSAMFKELTVA